MRIHKVIKEYFVRFITGKVGVYRSFFLHFVFSYILLISLTVGLDILFPNTIPFLPSVFIFVIFLSIAFIGTFFSAFRTLVNSGEPSIHRVVSGLVMLLMFVFLFFSIEDLQRLV